MQNNHYNMTETNTFPYMAIPWRNIKVWEKADILFPVWHSVSIWDSNADIMKMWGAGVHKGTEVHNCSDTNHICAFKKSSSYSKYSLMLLPFCHHLNLKALQNPFIWCRSYLKFIYITYALQTLRSSFKWIYFNLGATLKIGGYW